MPDWTVVSFVAFLLIFLGVGLYSATRKRESTDDYLVASRSISPWLAALSAVATNNSGFMFLGLVGYAYTSGISAAWLMIGWVIGDWIAWFLVHERLREKSEAWGAETIPSFLGHGLRGGKYVTVAGGLITLVFLGLYAAAQLKAGQKALYLFDWPPYAGAVFGAAIVVAYCFAGGIRASIWTDAAQSVVMIGSMAILFTVGVQKLGGMSAMWMTLQSIDPSLIDPFQGGGKFGFPTWVLGWFVAGFGVIGQPHIMIRAMAIDDPKNMAKARRIYIAWFGVFSALCVGVGLAARGVIEMRAKWDSELAMPELAEILLPGMLVGVMLAGLFAATISTADSQVLACSAALTQDVFPAHAGSYTKVKIATVFVTVFALLAALKGPDKIFELVTFAWSALASGLGPLLLIRSRGWPISTPTAMLTMLGGLAGMAVWRFVLEFDGAVYDVLPGMAAGFLVYAIANLLISAEKLEN